MKNVNKGELIISLSFFIFSIYFFYLSTQITGPVTMEIGPEVFPEFLLGTIMLLSILLIYNSIKKEIKSRLRITKNVIFSILFLLSYIYLLEIMGLIPLTPIALATYMYAIGIKNWKWLLFATIGISLVLIILFPILMLVPIPRGIGIFREINLIFY
ncbi:MAG: tripartite tricarboxylate transporter TctB family protein [Nitrososphaerales archaeon]